MCYDLVVSLGGNCSAAHNLQFRGMRHCAYPFDWVAMSSGKCVAYLAKGFRDGFRDFMLEENCELVPGNAAHRIIVKDAVLGFLFPNHFTREDFHLEFLGVAAKMRRRLDRLMNDLARAKTVMLILAASRMAFEAEDLRALEAAIRESFPGLKADIRVMRFSAESDSVEKMSECLAIYNCRRPMNDYDFYKTNFEWAFLDDVSLIAPENRENAAVRHKEVLAKYNAKNRRELFVNRMVYRLYRHFLKSVKRRGIV